MLFSTWRSSVLTSVAAVLAASAPAAWANYSCNGAVGYLGIDQSGVVVVALANSTPIHKICSVTTQGSWFFSPPACKSVYATLMAAKLAGKSMTIYYNENGYTCGTIPAWADLPTTYFIEGPN